MRLWSDFLNSNSGLERQKWAHYFTAYEEHLNRFVGQELLFLEIGCGFGGSLRMWKSYFGPQARIVGIDIRPDCVTYEDHQTSVRIGSQSDISFLQSVIDEFGVPDVVLDDGSHVMDDVNATFTFLYPLLKAGAVYMVEDMHTAYSEPYGGGLHKPTSFIERCKALIDELNGYFINGDMTTDFTRTTVSMHFYDSMVVLKKGRHQPPIHLVMTGTKQDA